MANIPRKFLKEIKYKVATQTKVDGQLKETYIESSIQGAVFPLQGKERMLELQGIIKKGTLKVYTNGKLDELEKIIVEHDGVYYNISKTIGGFTSDTLNTYYLEVRE